MAGGVIVNCPASDDDGAYPVIDQLLRYAVSKSVVGRFEPGIYLPRVAAVKKHQVGNDFERSDLGGGKQQAIGQYNACASALGRPRLEHAMA